MDVFGFGLKITSEVDVPGATELPPHLHTDLPCISIFCGAARLACTERVLGPYSTHAGTLLIDVPQCAKFLCMPGGDTLLVDPAADAADEHVSALLIATALPALLWQRGEVVLHAAAAILPGTTRAVAFPGASGSGKSTLLAALLHVGARIIADDVLCIRRSGADSRSFSVSGLPGCLHLPATVPHGQQQRSRVPVPQQSQVGSAELAGFVLLDSQDAVSGYASLKKLDPAAALLRLLQARHRERAVRITGSDARSLRFLADVAQSLPVYSDFNTQTPGELSPAELRALAAVAGR